MFRYIVGALIVGMLLFFWLGVLPYLQEVTCPYCNGKGFVQVGIIEIPCPYCKSAGKVPPYKKEIILQQMEKKQKEEMEKQKKEEAAITPWDTQPSNGQ